MININKDIVDLTSKIDFSGVILIKNKNNCVYEAAFGFSNRADEIKNKINTKFGIASGCKLFTAVAICQLVEKGDIAFETRLKDCLDLDFPNFDEDITIHHLLTHSSGMPDYFDEAVMENFEDLWKEKPMYLLTSLSDFLPMFQNNKMMFTPGERFHYNNAGYILLGLIIEQQTGISFTKYIETNLFAKCDMHDSGYFSLDRLPKNTAIGYIDLEDAGTWKTNNYAVPIQGGADGGAFISAPDMMKFWEALLSYKLLKEEATHLLLTPHICEEDEEYYGYGIWIRKKDNTICKYHVMGYDPGVSFNSSYYPQSGITTVIPSNKDEGPYDISQTIETNYIKLDNNSYQ
ncbi:serine hydrolase domain-containing protein [Peribacillus butanolivorans]|uniref:serine hydrolase domain-containing protein n=1 Tax=Peribacillus butanolivorans TaxID=421767 RepID=UPI00366EBCC9